MAVTVLQKPTTPNATNTYLLYALTSSLSTQPQFRYVVDVYDSGSSALKQRMKVYPNKLGAGIIDVAPVLNDYLALNINSYNWEISPLDSSSVMTSVKDFNLKFGEEYGTSPSSSRYIVPGTSDNLITVFRGVVEPDSGDYNFNTSSIANGTNILSNAPEAVTNDYNFPMEAQFVGLEDAHTITLLNPDTSITVNLYEQSVIGGVPQPTGVGNLITSSVYSQPEDFATFGIGPDNLRVAGITNDDIVNASYITVSGLGTPNYSLLLPSHSYYPCKEQDTYTRFTWINKYGAWDYYNVYNPLNGISQPERFDYQSPFPDYASATSPYNISNRGKQNFNNSLNHKYTISTDYVSQQTSDWLTELFDSEEVFVALQPTHPLLENMFIDPATGLNVYSEYNSAFKPIIINNVNYRWQENNKRNKLFQYTFDFEFSNKTFR